MSSVIMERESCVAATGDTGPASKEPAGKALHRIAAVRRRQGVALRTVARVLNVDVEEAARQEQEDQDLPLSTLQKWQAVLDVPIAELLVESDEVLSAPVLERARLIRVMKTAATILEKADSPRIRRLSETLVQQLVEIMPELEGIGPWHEYVGPRRRRDECGRIAERQLSSGLSRAIDSPDEAA